MGQLQDRPLLGELVKEPELARAGRGVRRQLYTAHGVPDVYKTARLAALAINGDRVPARRLSAEAVERRPKDAVVVIAVGEGRVQGRLLGLDVVDDTLVEVGGPKAPGPAG